MKSSETNTPKNNGLQEAFRRAHFLDHILPVIDLEAPTRAEDLEMAMVASAVDKDDIRDARREGMLQSIDDFNLYLDGGVNALVFDEQFNQHVVERLFQAHAMEREVVLPSPRTSTR